MLPASINSSQLIESTNFLNTQIFGQTFSLFRSKLGKLKNDIRNELAVLSGDLAKRGLVF
ncbi:MAG: hypothetical protein ACXX52_01070 [Candidatus Liberibacter asiaticus]|uniref:hypothetical protein n=1 Tax=Liberibacter asiaticus TaxID=34021 RepID=UPI003B9851CF